MRQQNRRRGPSVPGNLSARYACGGGFVATGPLIVFSCNGRVENPTRGPLRGGAVVHPPTTLVGRITVGFNIDANPFWTLDDLVKIYARLRKAQGYDVDASFLAQRGLYTHRKTRHTVDEPGAQIVVVYVGNDVSPTQFGEEMWELADDLRHIMHQETIIIAVQEGGKVYGSSFIEVLDDTRPKSPELTYRKKRRAYPRQSPPARTKAARKK